MSRARKTLAQQLADAEDRAIAFEAFGKAVRIERDAARDALLRQTRLNESAIARAEEAEARVWYFENGEAYFCIKARAARAEAALVKYGRHHDSCFCMKHDLSFRCTCGFDVALAATSIEEPQP